MNISIVDFRDNLSDFLNKAAHGGERVVIERRGKPVAALVTTDDLALLERLEDEADVKAARKALKEGGRPIPLDEIVADSNAARKQCKDREGITLDQYRKKHRL